MGVPYSAACAPWHKKNIMAKKNSYIPRPDLIHVVEGCSYQKKKHLQRTRTETPRKYLRASVDLLQVI